MPARASAGIYVIAPDLRAYGEAMRARTRKFLRSIDPGRVDKTVKSRTFGEFSIGQLIAILICDRLQHIGQIAYLRGLMTVQTGSVLA